MGSNTRYLLVSGMDFKEFKDRCMITAIKNDSCYNLLYASNALCGESGEFANFVKKYYRDGTAYNLDMKKELFDVLWYISYICDITGWTFDEIIEAGFKKVEERHGVRFVK